MDNAVQLPLNVYFVISSQCESVQTKSMPEVGENRLGGSYPSTVKHSTTIRIDFLLHFLGVGFPALFGSAYKKVNLSRFCTIRMPQTSSANLACAADGLGTTKLDRSVIAGKHVSTVAIKTLAGRTDAMRFVLSKREVFYRKQI